MKRKRAPWSSEPLLHGTSTAQLRDLQKAKHTFAWGLFLTDDENTAYEYAMEASRRWGGEPVILKVSMERLRKAGGKLWYDDDGDEIIIEQMVYEGPLPDGFILEVESVKQESAAPRVHASIERIGPDASRPSVAAPRATSMVRQHEYAVTDTSEYAAHFLGLIEGNENSGAYARDKRVPVIASALARVGVRQIQKIIGYGSFGVAAVTVDDHVVKLTGDVAEVQVGAVLVGKNLPHVVAIYGSWYVRGAKVNVQAGWNEKEQEIIYKLARVGILVEQRVATPEKGAPERRALSNFVHDWKEKSNNRFQDYAHLSEKAKREKLHTASYSLQNDLRGRAKLGFMGSDLFQDVAEAIGELRDVGVYAVDVHGGNIGFDEKVKHYRVFDVGVGSPPPDAPRPEVVGPGGGGTVQRQEATRPEGQPSGPLQRSFGFEVAEAVAPPMNVAEI